MKTALLPCSKCRVVIKGTIRWFNGMSGEGMIRLEDGRSVYCHFTAIDSVDTNGYHYPNYFDQGYLNTIAGRDCEVEFYENIYCVQCERVTLL